MTRVVTMMMIGAFGVAVVACTTSDRDVGADCTAADECKSGVCTEGKCAAGSTGKKGTGEVCSVPSECQSGVCAEGKCGASTPLSDTAPPAPACESIAGEIVRFPGKNIAWAIASTDDKMTFTAAENWVASLSVGGFRNWRLPTAIELMGMYDSSNPVSVSCSIAAYSGTALIKEPLRPACTSTWSSTGYGTKHDTVSFKTGLKTRTADVNYGGVAAMAVRNCDGSGGTSGGGTTSACDKCLSSCKGLSSCCCGSGCICESSCTPSCQ